MFLALHMACGSFCTDGVLFSFAEVEITVVLFLFGCFLVREAASGNVPGS